jgi:hypothetical protein
VSKFFVQCTEERPTCRTCIRRFGSITPCVFEHVAAPIDRTSLSVFVHVQSFSPHYALTVRPITDMLSSEVELHYYYTTYMAGMMPSYGRVELDRLWMIDVPQLSFAFDAVLSSILGLAALHSFCNDPSNIAMKLSAQYHLARTLKGLSALLSRIDGRTAEAVMLVAVLIAAQMRVRAAFVLDNEPYQLPFEIFHMHNGIGVLASLAIPFIQGSNVLVAVTAVVPISQTALHEETLCGKFLQDSHSLLEGTETGAFDPKTRRTYEQALNYLHTIYIALINREDIQWTRRRLCCMPANVPNGFVELLERRDPRALAILARFLALLKPCDDGSLYYHGCAEYEVEGIASLMPTDWLWAMEWPRQIITSKTLFGS